MLTNDDAKQNIADNVNRLMAIRGWDQSDLARASGESQMQISRICRGAILASSATLARISEALDCNMDKLIAPCPPQKLRVGA